MSQRRAQLQTIAMLAANIAFIVFIGAGLKIEAANQEPSSPPAPQAQVVTSAQVPDEELENFVRSATEVHEIQTGLTEKLATVQDPTQARQIEQEAHLKMAEIIKGCNLEVARYNQLAQSISASPEFGQRFQATRQALSERGNVPPCAAGAR